jgi:GNAT superfamily N-acetyltransferase
VPGRRPSYRTAGLLAALVLLGWLADVLLGGGAAHTAGWLLALLLVGGIPAVSAWAASHRADDQPPSRSDQPQGNQPQPEMDRPDRQIRPARPDELAELIEIERAADRLFPLAGYGETPGPASLEELRAATALLVSGEPPAGYARIEVVDGRAHLAGLSVRPRFMRQGRGSELVRAACAWAAEHGYPEITLCTFAEVPWNGPFYAKLGFVELAELTPGLTALRDAERSSGLDAMGRRVVLIRRTEPSLG